MRVKIINCEKCLQLRLISETNSELEDIVTSLKENNIQFKRYLPYNFPYSKKDYDNYYGEYDNRVIYLKMDGLK